MYPRPGLETRRPLLLARAALAELLSEYPSRIPGPGAFADANRIALLLLPGGIKADVSLAAFPFEREAIEGSSVWKLDGTWGS